MPEIKRYEIEQWVKTIATGEFHYKEVLDGQIDPTSYGRLRRIMWDLCHAPEPICESVGRRDGVYRPIQEEGPDIEWQDLPNRQDFPVELPFNLRKYVFIYPNTVIIVAGSKSAGKTGFLYRTVAMNMDKINTVILSNLEGGKEQFHDRFYAMNIKISNPAPFKLKRVTENFHDWIKWEDTLYIIDYIDAEGTELYLIGALISKIQKKLVNSVAIIGLQKPTWRDVAFGGEGTLKDATLYLAMDSNKLKIKDAKVPSDPKIIPKNMQWTFSYEEGGTKFENIEPYYGE